MISTVLAIPAFRSTSLSSLSSIRAKSRSPRTICWIRFSPSRDWTMIPPRLLRM